MAAGLHVPCKQQRPTSPASPSHTPLPQTNKNSTGRNLSPPRTCQHNLLDDQPVRIHRPQRPSRRQRHTLSARHHLERQQRQRRVRDGPIHAAHKAAAWLQEALHLVLVCALAVVRQHRAGQEAEQAAGGREQNGKGWQAADDARQNQGRACLGRQGLHTQNGRQGCAEHPAAQSEQ